MGALLLPVLVILAILATPFIIVYIIIRFIDKW